MPAETNGKSIDWFNKHISKTAQRSRDLFTVDRRKDTEENEFMRSMAHGTMSQAKSDGVGLITRGIFEAHG
jgi:hypothetical protein